MQKRPLKVILRRLSRSGNPGVVEIPINTVASSQRLDSISCDPASHFKVFLLTYLSELRCWTRVGLGVVRTGDRPRIVKIGTDFSVKD